jgi:MFS family permease
MTEARYGAPTSSLERDARRTNDAHAGEVKPGDIAVGVVIARTAEAFDFLVYAIASVVVFPKLVFPFTDPLQGTLYSFAIFALAFLARPLGTVIFTAIDRTYGRAMKLGVALMLLGIATVAIALLPGYEQLGAVSVWMLAVFRVCQGLALGGSWDGLASLLAVNAPPNRRGYYAMIPQLGAPLGAMVASALFAYIIVNLSAADFLQWGWRYPFLVAFAINVVALFARLRIVVTPEYTKLFATRELQPSPILETIRVSGRTILIGAFAPLAPFALFHIVTAFPLSWVLLFTPQRAGQFLAIQAVGALFGVAGSIASGWLADRFGRRPLLGITAVAIAVFSAVAPQLLNGGQIGEIAFVLSGFLLLGLAFGQASGVVAANFPMQYRYTGSALTSDLAWLFGAGFAPWVALALSSRFGIQFAGIYLLCGAAGTLLALFVNRQLTRKREG